MLELLTSGSFPAFLAIPMLSILFLFSSGNVTGQIKPIICLLFSIVMLLLIMPLSAIVLLLSYVLASYGLTIWCNKKNISLLLVLLLTVSLYTLLKKYTFYPESWVGGLPTIIGVSYLLFRIISFQIQYYQTKQALSLSAYLLYCLYFPAYASGPIQTINTFQEDFENMLSTAISKDKVKEGLRRLSNGILIIATLSPFWGWVRDIIWFGTELPPFMNSAEFLNILDFNIPYTRFLIASIVYLYFLYYNFSAYTHIAIGAGHLVGLRLPENFDRPFASKSFLEFWSRWHMSVSSWIKGYIFTPLLKIMIKYNFKPTWLAMIIPFFISFGLIGLWHGRTWPFLICGLMFAIGGSTNQLFRDSMHKTIGNDRYKSLTTNTFLSSAMAALTFIYIGLSIVGLWLDGSSIVEVLNTIKFTNFIYTTLVVWLMYTIIISCWFMLACTPFIHDELGGICRKFMNTKNIIISGFKLYIGIFFLILANTASPTFVYMAF